MYIDNADGSKDSYFFNKLCKYLTKIPIVDQKNIYIYGAFLQLITSISFSRPSMKTLNDKIKKIILKLFNDFSLSAMFSEWKICKYFSENKFYLGLFLRRVFWNITGTEKRAKPDER